MKKINIVGGGPAGLYFAILMRESDPSVDITIFERNKPDDIDGWGIVLNLGTIELLKKCDMTSYEEIVRVAKHWSNVDIFHHNQKISIKGKEYMSIARMMLLNTLRKRCQTLGITIHYEHKITDINTVMDCDLLIGADGANSFVRNAFKDIFKPETDIRNNKYIWLGTNHLFNTITHIFKKVPAGIFTSESYIYSNTHSTFIATCDTKTWENAGFANMSLDESVDYLSSLFEKELHGHKLLANSSAKWHQFPVVKNQNWIHPKVLLLGDALHTAHFSIGSGTRLAFEDAIIAARSLTEQSDIKAASKAFQSSRQPFIERYQRAAFDSLRWFEDIDNVIDLDIIPFAFQVMTRSSLVDIRSLKLQDPVFVEQYLQYQQTADALP